MEPTVDHRAKELHVFDIVERWAAGAYVIEDLPAQSLEDVWMLRKHVYCEGQCSSGLGSVGISDFRSNQ